MRLATTYLEGVEHLMVVLLRQLLDGPSHFEEPVRKSTLAMIDVSYDTEIPRVRISQAIELT